MLARLRHKVAIVTGAASGLGKAIARRFAAEGAAVLLADVNAPGGERVAGEIGAAGGVARFLATDVTSAEACTRLVESAREEFGRLDVMVNNAGIGGLAPVAEMAEAEWDATIAVNLKGVFLGSKYAFPALVANGGGLILNMASVAGLVAAPGMGAYGAAKAGVIQLTKVLAIEGAPHGVRANALCPTWTETPLLQDYVAQSPKPAAVRRRLEAMIPLGRLATPADVSAAAVYLASDEAAFITGVALQIDGGQLAGR